MIKSYDLAIVICLVAGITFGGYGESGAIDFEWDEDIVAITVTADGQHIYSRNNNRGMTVTLTLSQMSRTHLLLAGVLETQHGDQLGIGTPFIFPLMFHMTDPATGETITSAACVFLNRPSSNKGKKVGEVTYKMHLPNPIVTPAVMNLV